VLTPAGEKKLATARKTHVASVRALLSELFDEDELATLAELLERLPQRQLPCD
jgi:DNA-binding MarR family transcriptional regulator